MPKVEAKTIQKELEANRIWPVYWIYGSERLKSRELLGRIKARVLGPASASGLSQLQEERLEGTEVDPEQIVDSALSPSLLGGVRLLIVRDAHAIANAEKLAPLLGPAAPLESLGAVCVFLSKDLDARKKFSKLLIEKAAVVACEEVPDSEREAWIQYLARRRGITLDSAHLPALLSQEPWSLEILDQELEKISLMQDSEDPGLREADFSKQAPQKWLDHFLKREFAQALPLVSAFADELDQALPLLGLLSWNVRHLAGQLSGSGEKLNPYVADRIRTYASRWNLAEVQKLQGELTALDHSIKQTGLLPLGIWTQLTQFIS